MTFTPPAVQVITWGGMAKTRAPSPPPGAFFGADLATGIARLLGAGIWVGDLSQHHAFYPAEDGITYRVFTPTPREIFRGDGAAFVAWLTQQSPVTLAGNQQEDDEDNHFTHEALADLLARPTNHLSRAPAGADLAERVALSIDAGHGLARGHRDYCGQGLLRLNDRYLYGDVTNGKTIQPRYAFRERAAFVRWLARQSDYTLYGLGESPFWCGNQRICRADLEALATRVSQPPDTTLPSQEEPSEHLFNQGA